MLAATFILETHIFQLNVPFDAFVEHPGIFLRLYLLLVFRIKDLKDMGSCDFGLVHIRHEVRIVAYGYACEEDLVDCCEDI